MRKLEKPKKKRTNPIIMIGGLCFVVLGAATWYFGYVRPRLDAEPVRIYKPKPVQPTQKTATGVTEKGQTTTPTDTNMDTNQDVLVETEGASSHKASEKMATSENDDSVNSPNETQQMSSEPDEQERLRKLKRQEEYERIVAEGQ